MGFEETEFPKDIFHHLNGVLAAGIRDEDSPVSMLARWILDQEAESPPRPSTENVTFQAVSP